MFPIHVSIVPPNFDLYFFRVCGDSIVLLKQKRRKVIIAKPAKTLIISFNNNTPLVESNPGKHPVKV